MSFGFSVGDFVTVGSLIADIICSLQEVGGSKSEYQELLRELESLKHALSHLDKLHVGASSPTNLDSIKYAALSCRRPLEQFLANIKKYDKSLGTWSQPGSLRSAADKVRWAFGQKNEIIKLQSYLNIHVGTINILLAEYGLEMINISSEKNEANQLHVRERLESTHQVIQWIRNSVSAQGFAIQTTSSMLSKLLEMVSGEVLTSLKSFGEMVSKVCISNQQMYGLLLEIKGSVGLGDTRWTYFQAPLIVEDALGFKFPVPSEYDFELLDTIVKHRFLEGPGSLEVEAGNYELFNTKNAKQIISADVRLFPGTSITMAILVSTPELLDEECPMPRCKSMRTTVAPGGGRLCCECNVWSDKSNKKWNALQEVVGFEAQKPIKGKRKLEQGESPRKRLRTSSAENSIDCFKNVRWWLEEVAAENASKSSQENQPIWDHLKRPLNEDEDREDSLVVGPPNSPVDSSERRATRPALFNVSALPRIRKAKIKQNWDITGPARFNVCVLPIIRKPKNKKNLNVSFQDPFRRARLETRRTNFRLQAHHFISCDEGNVDYDTKKDSICDTKEPEARPEAWRAIFRPLPHGSIHSDDEDSDDGTKFRFQNWAFRSYFRRSTVMGHAGVTSLEPQTINRTA